MRKSKDRIPDKVLKEIFPKRLNGRKAPEELYTHLKKMILSGKLKRGQKLTYDDIALDFNVSRGIVQKVISRLKKDGLIISQWRKGLFVGQLLKETR
jgi:DNA-binding GntR family transcriptional regulator